MFIYEIHSPHGIETVLESRDEALAAMKEGWFVRPRVGYIQSHDCDYEWDEIPFPEDADSCEEISSYEPLDLGSEWWEFQ